MLPLLSFGSSQNIFLSFTVAVVTSPNKTNLGESIIAHNSVVRHGSVVKVAASHAHSPGQRADIRVCIHLPSSHFPSPNNLESKPGKWCNPHFRRAPAASVNVTKIAATLPRRPDFSLRISPQVMLLIKTKHQTLVLEVTGASVLPVSYKCEYTPIRVPVHLEV